MKCDNPKCNNDAIIAIRTLMLCGKCAIKAMKFIDEEKKEKDRKLIEDIINDS